MKKQQKRWPLRNMIMITLLGLWVIPMLVLTVLVGWYINRQAVNQIGVVVEQSMENSVRISSERLNQILDKMLDPTDNAQLYVSWQNYQTDHNVSTLSSQVMDYLEEEYEDSDLLLSTVLVLNSVEEDFYVTNPDFESARIIENYYIYKNSDILPYAQTLGDQIGYLRLDNGIYLIKNLTDSSNQVYGTLVVELNVENVFSAMKEVGWSSVAAVWLDDISIPLEVTNQTQWDDNELSHFYRSISSSEGSLEIPQGEMTFGTLKEANFNLKYVLVSETGTIYNEQVLIVALIVGVLILLALQTSLTLLVVRHQVEKPANTLGEVTQKIAQGNFGIQVDRDIAKCEEFVYLSEQVNAMSKQLKEQFETIYREEIALRDAEIKALQSQINPHFLGNTLEIINWEARLAGNEEVSLMLEALTTMMEAVNNRGRKVLIPLQEELVSVEAYLTIIQYRVGKRLDVYRDFEQDTLDCLVPRLILQPVIENAIEHGVDEGKEGPLFLRSYLESEEWMIIEIENSGRLTTTQQATIQNLLSDQGQQNLGGNIGIVNVDRRLKTIFGEEAGLEIFSTSHETTISRLKIKADYASDHDIHRMISSS